MLQIRLLCCELRILLPDLHLRINTSHFDCAIIQIFKCLPAAHHVLYSFLKIIAEELYFCLSFPHFINLCQIIVFERIILYYFVKFLQQFRICWITTFCLIFYCLNESISLSLRVGFYNANRILPTLLMGNIPSPISSFQFVPFSSFGIKSLYFGRDLG